MTARNTLFFVISSGLILVALLFISFTPKEGIVDTKLFLGKGDNQPLIVAFGGSEGGNIWASDQLESKRKMFLDNGYAFLAVGYFGGKKTPKYLKQISLNAIHDSIINISNHPKINSNKIGLFGGSRGAELALNLASRYKEFKAVTALVPSHVSFPAFASLKTVSSWAFNGEDVNFVPQTKESLKLIKKGDWLNSFKVRLKDENLINSAKIKVENINGPILLISAKNDEMWPSAMMSEEIMNILKSQNFEYYQHHISLEGGHTDLPNHIELTLNFFNKHLSKE